MKTNTVKKLSSILLFGALLTGCTKAGLDQLNPNASATTATNTAATSATDPALEETANLTLGTTTTATSTTTPGSPLSAFNVNYTSRPTGTYALSQAATDYSNIAYWGDNTSLYNGNLRTAFIKGMSGTTGGSVSRIQVADGTQYQLEFKMMFDALFDWTSGKAGFGLYLGDGNTGSTSGANGNGGSVRLSFAKTADGRAVLKPCVYYKDQVNTYGDDFGKSYPATGSLVKYLAYNVKMIVKSNTGSNTDGRVAISVNGVTLMDQPIRWTTNDLKRFINSVCFENFSNNTYQANANGYIYYNNVVLTPLSTPPVNTSGGAAAGATAPTTPTALYNFGINWTNRANSAYGLTQATTDFLSVPFWGANTDINGGRLRTTLLANTVGPDGGNVSRVAVPNGSEYQLSYDMMFDPNFDFSWGGKIGFGLFLGEGNTGGDPAWDGNGGSVRIMWYKNTSTGPVFLKPYLYYKDQPGTYGDDFGKMYPSTGNVQTGVWYNIKIYAKSNTGSNTDGRVRIVINGTTLLDQAIRWTTNDLKRLVNNVCFENFRGGSDAYWQSSTNGTIYFNNVNWQKLSN